MEIFVVLEERCRVLTKHLVHYASLTQRKEIDNLKHTSAPLIITPNESQLLIITEIVTKRKKQNGDKNDVTSI